jgi:arginine N-succinyltransferase
VGRLAEQEDEHSQLWPARYFWFGWKGPLSLVPINHCEHFLSVKGRFETTKQNCLESAIARACNVGLTLPMNSQSADPNPSTEIAILRPAVSGDIDGVMALAVAGGSGLTNLPPDRDMLTNRIEASERAICDSQEREAGAAIMLVIECGKRIVGVSGIFPRVGAQWPFYSYRLTRQASRSLAVGKSQAQVLLNLVNDFDGEAEVGMLFVDPAMRGSALGKLAARGRYLFMAAHRDWFGKRVMAELRGYQDNDGNSPVWEAIGRHFYGMDFQEADRTGAVAGNQVIADLGPRYPLYQSLLPAVAQAALGKPHNDGRPAFEMLIEEGFQAGEYVDIFDGGPTVFADIDAIKTVREARTVTMGGIGVGGENSLIAVGSGPQFRVARGKVDAQGRVDATLGEALNLQTRDVMLVVEA